jgi:hypothetical protein
MEQRMDFLTPELLDRGWQGLVSVIVLRWLYQSRKVRRNNAKANGNGKNRRLGDAVPGNPGNPHGVADLCARHDASIKLMFEKISGVERKFDKELREVRDRVIHLEAKAEKQNERRQ